MGIKYKLLEFNRLIAFSILLATGILFSSGALGAAITWGTTASGDWATASNWSGGVVPGAADNVTIGSGKIVTISTVLANKINKLTVNGKLIVSSGASLYIEQNSTSSPLFNISGGVVENYGSITIFSNVANANTALGFSDNATTDDKFTNFSTGSLTINISAQTSMTSSTGNCINFNQFSAGRNATLTFGGTLSFTVPAGTRFMEFFGTATLDGAAVIGGSSDYKNFRFMHFGSSSNTNVSIASTADITFYSGFSSTNGALTYYNSSSTTVTNNGKLTIHGGIAVTGSAIFMNQPTGGSSTFTNSSTGTLIIDGNYPLGSVNLSGASSTTNTFNNHGSGVISIANTHASASALLASINPTVVFNNDGILTLAVPTSSRAMYFGDNGATFTNNGIFNTNNALTGNDAANACVFNNSVTGILNANLVSDMSVVVSNNKKITFNNYGTITGIGIFADGTFNTLSGTINPGIGSGTGIMRIYQNPYTFTGKCIMQIKGTATAGTDYDQILFGFSPNGTVIIDPTASIEVATSGGYIPTHLDNIPLITSYVGRTNTFTPANITKPAHWTMDYSSKNTNIKYLAPSLSVTASTNVSTLGDLTNTDLTLNPGNQLTLDATTTIKSIIALPGSKITLSSGSPTINGLTLQSDATGTATFVDNNNVLPQIISATVQQYLSSARNWYLTSPISGATVPTGQTYYSYDETGGNTGFTGSATAYWVAVPQSTLIDPMKGYIAQPAATTTKSYTGTLNSGTQTIELTRTNSASKPGFNLVANPYPSYLDWQMVDTAATNILSTVWYRTKTTGGDYTFDTYNGGLLVATSNGENAVTQLIPPMQAFWVRVKSGFTGGTLTFDNTMRKHVDNVGNKFKAPALSETQLVRLRVSNGTNADETLICFNPKATNGSDSYDSPKMSNNSASIPEIYTQAGTEKLVINGMIAVQYDTEIPLGFSTGQVNDFTISNTEMKNFEVGTRVILKDKLLNTETELGEGVVYSFSSQPTAPTTDRFSVLFRAPSLSTELESPENHNAQVFVNAANQITIIALEKSNYAIFNALGQKVKEGLTVSDRTSINNKFEPGMYVVTVTKNGKSFSTRVVLNGK